MNEIKEKNKYLEEVKINKLNVIKNDNNNKLKVATSTNFIHSNQFKSEYFGINQKKKKNHQSQNQTSSREEKFIYQKKKFKLFFSEGN